MSEVTLLKRFYALVLIALVALFASACTREKPADTPVPTVIAQRTVVTPPPLALGTVSAANVTPTIMPPLILTATIPVTPVATVIPTQVLPPPTPVATPVPTTNPGTYTVQWGDWLSKIAAQFGVTTQAIVAANPGINPNFISPGQVLQIPGNNAGLTPAPTSVPSFMPTSAPSTYPPVTMPSTYTVQRGDWIYALARRFGVSVAALLSANPGINPNLLYPGQVLNIPSSSGTTPPDPSTPPSGNTYTVQRGDTLFSIAVRFKTTTFALQIRNKLANPNFIFPGQVLTIPQ